MGTKDDNFITKKLTEFDMRFNHRALTAKEVADDLALFLTTAIQEAQADATEREQGRIEKLLPRKCYSHIGEKIISRLSEQQDL